MTRVRLGYLPHYAMLELQNWNTGRRACALVSEDFGAVVDDEDINVTACDL